MYGKTLLITGHCGLIGSEVAVFFHRLGFRIHGVDNNQRAVFFGPQGDIRWNQQKLSIDCQGIIHHEIDIRDRAGILELIKTVKPSVIVHAAAQPSHDRAADIPFDDFDTNATGTLNLLEAARRYSPEAPFIHLSTNKVYGSRPNFIPLTELETRWEYCDPAFSNGIDENLPIDQTTHSLFGASKIAADIMVQEYGQYFNMPTCCLRCGCLTGPNHSGVPLHGFLSYLVKCNLEQIEYTVLGYKGKQVRDNLHSRDVASFINEFRLEPRSGEVYNLGGGKNNSCSIIEAFRITEKITGMAQKYSYADQNRKGDHICYYSNLSKIGRHYPTWRITTPIEEIIKEIVDSLRQRSNK